MISEPVYQAREPHYELRDKRDKMGGACYCFNVYADKKNPEDNIVVDADRYGVARYDVTNHSPPAISLPLSLRPPTSERWEARTLSAPTRVNPNTYTRPHLCSPPGITSPARSSIVSLSMGTGSSDPT